MIPEYNKYPKHAIPDAVERLQLIREERIAYQKAKGRSYYWKEVKEMALNKKCVVDYSIEIRPLAALEIFESYN